MKRQMSVSLKTGHIYSKAPPFKSLKTYLLQGSLFDLNSLTKMQEKHAPVFSKVKHDFQKTELLHI